MVSMCFNFNDKQITIKHLGNIVEVKKINSQTIKLKEMIIQGQFTEDLLFYDKESVLNKDVKMLHRKMNEYMKCLNNIKEQMGFSVDSEAIEDERKTDEE